MSALGRDHWCGLHSRREVCLSLLRSFKGQLRLQINLPLLYFTSAMQSVPPKTSRCTCIRRRRPRVTPTSSRWRAGQIFFKISAATMAVSCDDNTQCVMNVTTCSASASYSPSRDQPSLSWRSCPSRLVTLHTVVSWVHYTIPNSLFY